MATMLPNSLPVDTPSSERLVFDRLKRDPGCEGWTVLHSLGLAHRGTKPYGEIDFVILVPGLGIACLEVKGGRVRCAGGSWFTMNRDGQETELRRSPFLQAREGMFALREEITRRFPDGHAASQVSICSGVIFPSIEAPPLTPEIAEWEVVDIHLLRQPLSSTIRRMLCGHRSLVGHNRPVTADTLKAICNILRPDFDRPVSRGTTVRITEEVLLKLTNEQYDALDAAERNDHCLVDGAAGTGKTMLALELARRSARAGKKVLLLCYNRLLGESLRASLTASPANDHPGHVTAGSIHQMLREIILSSSHKDDFLRGSRDQAPEVLFGDTYPLFGLLAIAESGMQYDHLIVDEVQDLASRDILDLFDQLLVGGLAGGRWIMVGDFRRQAIFLPESGVEDPTTGSRMDSATGSLDSIFRSWLNARGTHPLLLPLTKNCRNSRPIGQETALLSGFDSPPYRLGKDDALKVDYRYYDRTHSAAKRLDECLQQLRRDGIPQTDIVILSPHRFERSAASSSSRAGGISIVPVRSVPANTPPGAIAFSTIHAFKGMESPVVVLCDIEDVESATAQSLLYVGMSRARSLLIILLSRVIQPAIERLIRLRLERELH